MSVREPRCLLSLASFVLICLATCSRTHVTSSPVWCVCTRQPQKNRKQQQEFGKTLLMTGHLFWTLSLTVSESPFHMTLTTGSARVTNRKWSLRVTGAQNRPRCSCFWVWCLCEGLRLRRRRSPPRCDPPQTWRWGTSPPMSSEPGQHRGEKEDMDIDRIQTHQGWKMWHRIEVITITLIILNISLILLYIIYNFIYILSKFDLNILHINKETFFVIKVLYSRINQ